jgi:hypothetical protein
MRRAVLLLAAGTVLSACGMFKRGGEPPAHRSPTSTSIYGQWVLASPVDSTAFAGATSVQMDLGESAFRILAAYPGQPDSRVTGTVSNSEGGVIVLTPMTGGTSATYTGRSMALIPGQPISLIASAAGGSLVFKPPHETDPTPSSNWMKRANAEAAGLIRKDAPKP